MFYGLQMMTQPRSILKQLLVDAWTGLEHKKMADPGIIQDLLTCK